MSDDQNNAVINLLSNIIKDTSEIKTNLAVNTTETAGIKDHLKTLNGRVAKQEERVQVAEASIRDTADFIKNAKDTKKGYDAFWKRTLEKLLWAIIPVASIGVWKIGAYLINQGVF